MIEIDTIIPEDLKRDHSQQTQSRLLWMKVLDHAYKDSLWKKYEDRWLKIAVWKRHIPTLSWFVRPETGIGSLEWVCDVIGLYEPDEVRLKVIGLTIREANQFQDIFELMESKK